MNKKIDIFEYYLNKKINIMLNEDDNEHKDVGLYPILNNLEDQNNSSQNVGLYPIIKEKPKKSKKTLLSIITFALLSVGISKLDVSEETIRNIDEIQEQIDNNEGINSDRLNKVLDSIDQSIKDTNPNVNSGEVVKKIEEKSYEYSDFITNFTQTEEGFRLEPYYDTKGFMTIGYGTLITKEKRNETKGKSKENKVEDENISFALKKLSEKYPTLYQYKDGETSIDKETAIKLFKVKRKKIFSTFLKRIPDHKHLPHFVLDILSDLSYNMGGSFFKNSDFIVHIKKLSELYKESKGKSTKEIKDLLYNKIPIELINSSYYKDLTKDEKSKRLTSIPTKKQIGSEPFDYIKDHTGRPVRILNYYKTSLDKHYSKNESKYSLKKALFS